jgi:hypothetical protein
MSALSSTPSTSVRPDGKLPFGERTSQPPAVATPKVKAPEAARASPENAERSQSTSAPPGQPKFRVFVNRLELVRGIRMLQATNNSSLDVIVWLQEDKLTIMLGAVRIAAHAAGT